MTRTPTSLRILRTTLAIAPLFAAGQYLNPPTAAAAEPATVKVMLSDLDLNSEQGQATLAQRLRIAIDKVCAEAGSTSSPITAPGEVKRCRQSAEAGVQRQLEQRSLSPVLVARH